MSDQPTPTERVRATYRAIADLQGTDVFITVIPESEALAAAAKVEGWLADGEDLPLAGLVAAVKDNIDVAGVTTTAGCPAFAYLPEQSARCVSRLSLAGAVVIGKTNLDQFATGLVGTRSPYGAPSSVLDPSRISGGSSSGSAVAVALGIVDFALGTDTAGSGRVPASFNAIVGTKPTKGLVPVTGVVPACPSLDCVSIFTTTVALGSRVLAVISGQNDRDVLSRRWGGEAPLSCRPLPVIAVPDPDELGPSDAPWRASFDTALARLRDLGAELRTISVATFLEAGALLYGGAFVAERYASVGTFVDAHPDEVDPVVGPIIAAASALPAHRLVSDGLAAATAAKVAEALFDEVDALMMPTVPEHPLHSEVAEEPVLTNARVGKFTTFCNLLDLAAIALPVPGGAASAFGVTFFGPAFSDQMLAEVAGRFAGEGGTQSVGAPSEEVVVVGAHLSGQPLNHQLTEKRGRLVRTTTTAPEYRLYALPTTPPKPGLVRTAEDGAAIEVEVWALPPAHYAAFVRDVAPPLAIGPVALADGTTLPGFVLAADEAPDVAEEITAFGGWRRYRASLGS